MAYLLDTGILLRLIDKDDPLSVTVELAVTQLVEASETLFTTTQNISELWNVGTRPRTEHGFGLPAQEVLSRIQTTIEPLCHILREHRLHYADLMRLLASYEVRGKQVHDARLVVAMLTWRIESILTLNARHLRRYEAEGIRVVTPQDLLNSEQSS
jgi:predicted nucleic acid-binding protein